MGQVLKETVPSSPLSTGPLPLLLLSLPTPLPPGVKKQQGKGVRTFSSTAASAPMDAGVGRGKTWVWRAEATGAAVIFIAVLIRGPTSIYGHNNKRHRDSQCIFPAVEISLGSWRLCSRAENERGN